MPILSASSVIVMPGCALTSASAWAARVPLPRGRPRRPLPDFARVDPVPVLPEPRGRPGPRRTADLTFETPTPASAAAAGSLAQQGAQVQLDVRGTLLDGEVV